MALTNGLEAIKKLLSCVQADGSQVSHVIVEEKDIKETGNMGNCSVCWKLSKMPNDLRYKADDLIKAYTNDFQEEPIKYNYNLYDLENVFYRWLYLE